MLCIVVKLPTVVGCRAIRSRSIVPQDAEKTGKKTFSLARFAFCIVATLDHTDIYRLNLLKSVSHFIKYSSGTTSALAFWSCCLTPLATSTFQPLDKVILYFSAKAST